MIENRDRTIEELDRKVASQAERIQELEDGSRGDRNSQLQRFAEAYKTLKTGLQFYEAQAKGAAEQHYQLRKQYETGLAEHKKTLSATFKELSARYEATAKQEIAKAVASVKANEQSAEEICKNFARNLLKDFGSALPTESKNSGSAFHSIGEALKSLPELKEIVKEFREWRDAAWERVTGQSYGREQEKQSSQGTK